MEAAALVCLAFSPYYLCPWCVLGAHFVFLGEQMLELQFWLLAVHQYVYSM